MIVIATQSHEIKTNCHEWKARPFDPSAIRKPRSFKLHLDRIQLLPSGGWTDAATVDLVSVPQVIQRELAKLEKKGKGQFAFEDTDLEKIPRLIEKGKIEVVPLALYGEEALSGFIPEAVILGNASAGGALMLSMKHYSYFSKLYPGCRFFTSEKYSHAVIKRENGETIGLAVRYVPNQYLAYTTSSAIHAVILREALAVMK